MWKSQIELREENGKLSAFYKNGREIPIPKRPVNMSMLEEWLRYLSIDVLDAARRYYYEVWNWETGSEDDLALVRACEEELEARVGRLESVRASLPKAKDISLRALEQQLHRHDQ